MANTNIISQSVDVMVEHGTKFYCQLQYQWCQLFPLNRRDLVSFVLSKRPTLKFRDDFQIFIGKEVIAVDQDNINQYIRL